MVVNFSFTRYFFQDIKSMKVVKTLFSDVVCKIVLEYAAENCDPDTSKERQEKIIRFHENFRAYFEKWENLTLKKHIG